MKNLRKKSPDYIALKTELKQTLAVWHTLTPDARQHLCARFLLSPELKKQKKLTPDLLSGVMTPALALEQEASGLVANDAGTFAHLGDLLKKSASRLPDLEQPASCSCC